MADEDPAAEGAVSPAQTPLVSVTFQRNIHRKEKYLEAEPKALGITQVGLTVYEVICVSMFRAKDLIEVSTDIPFFFSSLLVIIAGNVAIAAKSLHLPTLRACLGLQILACIASIINMICTMVQMGEWYHDCWRHHFDNNSTDQYIEVCHQIENIHSHFFAGGLLIQATLLAISVSLAAYCCKVVNCCGPAPKVPVIIVQTPENPESSRVEPGQTGTED